MKKLSFGVLGLGHIGQRHARLLTDNPATHLAALCDIRPQAALGLPTTSPPFYHSLAEMLAAETALDVVCIATPNGLHAEQALMALEAGKHVIIEKPMALSKVDCEKIIYTALKLGQQVFCVMQNRYSPPVRWLKQLVDEQRLGDIFLVEVNCYWNRNDAYYQQSDWRGTLDMDGGPLFTQFSHFIDLIYWLFGDLRHIKASFGNFKHQHNTAFEDSGLLQFELANGGMGSLSYSTASWDRNFGSSMTILGQKGSLTIGGQYMDKIVDCHIDDYSPPLLPLTNPPNDYGPYKGSAANHHYVFANVVDTLRGQATITTNALEGMKVVDIIERIYTLR